MKYAYYPGCTATTTSIEYEESVREIAGYLDIEFTEIPDWTCCGASSGHVINRELSLALPSRNLAIAEKMNMDVVAPCPGCLLRFKTAEYELGRDSTLKSKIEEDIGTKLNLSYKSRHVLEILHQDIGLKTIREKVVRPLEGLKVAPYYGCVLVRPPEVTSFDNPENPIIMDEILEALGVKIVDWSYKVDCCGGSLSIVVPEIVQKLSGKIIQGAREAGADMVVTACGICQLNLDMRQPKGPDTELLPALYFSELMAHAFGSKAITGWAEKHFVDPSPTLAELGLL